MPKKDKVQEIIENSGNDFHLEVANLLRSNGWETTVGAHYSDPATNKSREIDIIAIKKYTVVGDSFRRDSEQIAVRLFVECKYIKEPNVLWFETKHAENALKLAKKNSILRDVEDHALRNTSTLPHKIHHYLQDNEVMKLGSKSGNLDPLYEAMNSSLNAMIYYREHQYMGTPHRINFPVIAVDSFKNLNKRNQNISKGYEAINNIFQMEVDYSFIGKDNRRETEFFLIDVVSRDELQNFLNILENNDISIIRGHLAFQTRRNQYEQMQQEKDDLFDPYSIF